MKLPLEEYFKYHPPKTKERQEKHDKINEASLAFARLIDELIEDNHCKQMAFFALQQARMFANQGCTIDEILSTSLADSENFSD